jgi:hypothetical protein
MNHQKAYDYNEINKDRMVIVIMIIRVDVTNHSIKGSSMFFIPSPKYAPP